MWSSGEGHAPLFAHDGGPLDTQGHAVRAIIRAHYILNSKGFLHENG